MTAGGIAERLARVHEGIAAAVREAGRAPGSVRLVAASKGQPASSLLAAAAAGQLAFGENYAREMRQKRLEMAGSLLNLEWHFIGRVQTANAKDIVSASLVHGVGSVDQARALAKKSEGTRVLVLLQVSLWSEAAKNGFARADIERDLDVLRSSKASRFGPHGDAPESADARRAFAAVRELRDALAPDLSELSMGMSGDYREAILEGATLVRVGTALFRPAPTARPSEPSRGRAMKVTIVGCRRARVRARARAGERRPWRGSGGPRGDARGPPPREARAVRGPARIAASPEEALARRTSCSRA